MFFATGITLISTLSELRWAKVTGATRARPRASRERDFMKAKRMHRAAGGNANRWMKVCHLPGYCGPWLRQNPCDRFRFVLMAGCCETSYTGAADSSTKRSHLSEVEYGRRPDRDLPVFKVVS